MQADPSLWLLHEDVGESYSAVTRSAAAAVGADVCHIALYDRESDELIARRPHYAAAPGSIPQFRFPLDDAPASARVVRSGEPYLSNDPGNDPLYDPSARERGVRSVLTVPVQRGDVVLGLLYALNKPGGFSADDVRTLGSLADAAAVTLENIRFYAEEHERRVLNESLREVSRVLVGGLTEDAALGTVLDQMWRVVRYQAAAVVLLESDRLRAAAVRGGEPGAEVLLEEAGDLRETLASRQIGVLGDSGARLPQLGIRAAAGKALAVPLLAKGEVLGAFVVAFDSDHPPGLQDGRLVSAFAEHAALFLDAGYVLRRERLARSRVAAVARITRLAANRLQAEPFLKVVAPEMLGLSGADRAVLYLKHPRGSVLVPVADAGLAPEEEGRARELRLDLAEGPLAPLVETLLPLAFQTDSNPPPTSICAFPDTRSLLAIPLVSRDEVLGAIVLCCLGRSRGYDRALVEFLFDVAQQVALGLENARLFEALSRMAATDELTQLANRRKFAEALRVELARARRTGTAVSMVLADIDHLKRVNDTHGHPSGDAAIRHVADALKRGRRETDIAARLGGEEFALLLPGTDRVGAVKIAERIRRELAGSSIPTVGTVTVSLGVATCPEDGASDEELYGTADERLYAAKSSGRNQVCYVSLPPGSSPAAKPPRRPLGES